MATDKKISKDQAIKHEYVRRHVLAGDVIVVYPPVAEPHYLGSKPTYPRYVALERPKPARERIRLTVGGNRIDGTGHKVPHVSPGIYSLAFRQAWKKLQDHN